MTPQERAIFEALMSGEESPAWRLERPAWMADGDCLEHPEIEFVPLNPVTEENAADARAICGRCSCRVDCLAYALADATLLGIWGGTTTAERRRMRKRHRAA